ncbi:MAG: type II secretory pathway pseudopilin PulG [Glaciecola sp.]|jgi:type II secretory pathway pseudopilin PulG
MHDERGFLLVEVLLAIVILGLAVAGILGGVGTAAAMSGLNQQHTVVEAATRSMAENVKAAEFPTTCPATYALTGASGVTATVTVSYAAAAATPNWVSTCTAGAALHRVSLIVQSPDGRVTRTLDLVKRNPA